MTIEDHLKQIKKIQNSAAREYKKRRLLCFFGFHKTYYKSGDGIMELTECIYCKKSM